MQTVKLLFPAVSCMSEAVRRLSGGDRGLLSVMGRIRPWEGIRKPLREISGGGGLYESDPGNLMIRSQRYHG